jgi:hypothetical protein
MARHSKSVDDRPSKRPLPVIEGAAGSILAGGMIAGAVAGAVDERLTGQVRDTDQSDTAIRTETAPRMQTDAGQSSSATAAPPAERSSNSDDPEQPKPQRADDAATAPSASNGQSPGSQAQETREDQQPASSPDALPPSDMPPTLRSDTKSDEGSVKEAAPGNVSERIAGELESSLSHLVERITALSSGDSLSPALQSLTQNLTDDLAEAAARMTSSLEDALQTQVGRLAEIGAGFGASISGHVAGSASLGASSALSIPSTILGAESGEAPLSALSIALGAEASASIDMAIESRGVIRDVTLAASAEAAPAVLVEMGMPELGSAPMIGFAGLSYLDTMDDGAPHGSNGGLLHGFI